MNCIFCKIINNEIPSYTIYEDDQVKVILDINPDVNGHTLIIPKKHIVDMTDIDEATLWYLNQTANKIYQLYQEKLHIDGMTLLQNNGWGQIIKHYHLHLIPRYENDGYHNVRGNAEILPVEQIFNKIKG